MSIIERLRFFPFTLVCVDPPFYFPSIKCSLLRRRYPVIWQSLRQVFSRAARPVVSRTRNAKLTRRECRNVCAPDRARPSTGPSADQTNGLTRPTATFSANPACRSEASSCFTKEFAVSLDWITIGQLSLKMLTSNKKSRMIFIHSKYGKMADTSNSDLFK